MTEAERAAELLGVPAGTDPAAARAAFLGRLERVEFAPPAHWCAGLGMLAGSAGAARLAGDEIAEARRQELEAEVNHFSEEYWSLPPMERDARWQLLRDLCAAEPPLRLHLDHLAIGLDLEASEFTRFDGTSGLVAELVRELFPLQPAERAARRQAWFDQIGRMPKGYLEAAALLRNEAPQLTALEPALLARLDEAGEAQTRAERPVSVVRSSGRSATVSEGESGGYGRYAWLIGLLVIGTLRGLFGTSSSSSRNDLPPPRPRYYDQAPELPEGFKYAPPPGKTAFPPPPANFEWPGRDERLLPKGANDLRQFREKTRDEPPFLGPLPGKDSRPKFTNPQPGVRP
jgi:hypothetical protein